MRFRSTDLRPLGSTGLMVSPLGLGTVKFGRNTGVKYPAGFEIPNDTALDNLLSTARELGINLLDTAPAYGESETRLGKLLIGHRSEWILGTKVGESFEDGQSHWDFSAKATRTSLERSLKRLRTDYLDYVLVHSSGEDHAVMRETDVLEVLAEAKTKGQIRAFGVSTKSRDGGLLALDLVDIVMMTFNLKYTDELPVIRKAQNLGKGILVKKGLVSGHTDDPGLAIKFILDEPGVSSAIVGTINREHLTSNVASALRS
ncbi:MAG: aldo/keto reductase [Pseudomonadales bacterium]